MSYKIAVGSSNGTNVDLKFGEVKKFIIFEVEGQQKKLLEIRDADIYTTVKDNNCCNGNRNCCCGPTDVISKVELVKDCRCIVCKKVGFQAQKQLERKAISVFDIEGEVEMILKKIISYYGKIDKHR